MLDQGFLYDCSPSISPFNDFDKFTPSFRIHARYAWFARLDSLSLIKRRSTLEGGRIASFDQAAELLRL